MADSTGWSIGCGTVSLAAPNMFGALGPNAFYIHAVFNLFALAIVFCFYPEVSCRTLEEIDFLFASKSPFVWETEKRFRELKLQHPEVVHGGNHDTRYRTESFDTLEKGKTEHLDRTS